MKITTQLLEDREAYPCEDQVILYNSLFPEGTDVTKESCLKALEGGIDFNWAYRNLLNDRGTEKPLLDAYNANIKPFWDDYEANKNHFRDKYLADTKAFRDVYEAAIKPLLETHNNAESLPCFNTLKQAQPFRDAYDTALTPFRDSYLAVLRRISDKHDNDIAPFQQEYQKQLSLLFCKQFNEENP